MFDFKRPSASMARGRKTFYSTLYQYPEGRIIITMREDAKKSFMSRKAFMSSTLIIIESSWKFRRRSKNNDKLNYAARKSGEVFAHPLTEKYSWLLYSSSCRRMSTPLKTISGVNVISILIFSSSLFL